MKVLRLPAYCIPEKIASSHLQADRLEGFAKAGLDIEIHTPTPTRGVDADTRRTYKKIKHETMHDGHVHIYRFSMFGEGRNPLVRAFRYVLTNVIQYSKGCRAKDVDVIYASSTPPTQGVLCGWIKKHLSRKYKRPVPMVYNLQDVFPDSLVTTGLTTEGSILWKIGRKMEDATYRYADKIIVITEAMKRNILEKGVPEEKIVVVPNWIDTDAVTPVEKADNRLFEEFGIDREKFTVVYAGNFGAAQGAHVVLEAAKLLPEMQFVIFGGGAEFEAAKQQAKTLPNVIINGLLPQDRVPEVYSLGDVCLITCKKGVGNSGMPSKTWSIMACNTPIIAAFDTDSELAEILQTSNTGVCVEPEDPKALAEAISAQATATCRFTNAREYVCRYASKTASVGKYIDVIKSCL
ncbi:MAG: glycosyltransferase family 4 protein [Oscillospiraceae bacterium]|nr:glycosyltransferase family 4 protein [Oscillospiraceae bacterium]